MDVKEKVKLINKIYGEITSLERELEVIESMYNGKYFNLKSYKKDKSGMLYIEGELDITPFTAYAALDRCKEIATEHLAAKRKYLDKLLLNTKIC